MKRVACHFLIFGSVTLGYLVASSPAIGQISSDGTLTTNVSQSGNVVEITGGAQAGGNLFHSFKDFSLPTDNTAFFNNAANIANIISRVTGGNISNIDGLIRANGGANLILINPSGINFGANARLNIGGSFLGSTATSLKFADGTEFSATNPQATPRLTISVPLGLQFGQNPSGIRVQGKGHSLTVADPIFSPVARGSSLTGLSVQPGQSIALVGGDITLEGGTLTAERGRIELGSVALGLVRLNPTSQGWTLGYENVASFRDIELRSRALADASSTPLFPPNEREADSGAAFVPGGSIQVQGRRLSVRDGSLILIQNQGFQSAGSIFVNAADALEVSGTNPDGTIRSSLTNETVGVGKGGDVAVSTRQLVVQDGGTIVAKTFSPATGGDLNLNASESTQVIGASTINPRVTSSIVAATFGAGDSGNNTLSTGRLTAIGGGSVATATFGAGKGGNLSVNATDSIELLGVEPNLFAPSGLLASAFNTGNAGNLTINTSRLAVRDGGRVDASTFATGSAGSVTINASDSVEVKGTVPGSINPSLVISSANLVDQSLQQTLGLPPVPSGKSGDVTINTGLLSVTDRAQVTARNDGLGNSGNVRISARSIFLDNEGAITADLGGTIRFGQFSISSPQTLGGGKGGDIAISTQRLVVQGGASISTSTFTNATGGDISVDAPESVQVVGFSPANPRSLSFISGSTFGSGDSGNVNVSTGRLAILDGGNMGAGTFGAGSGGDVTVNATQSVEVSGAEPSQLAASLLGVSTLNAGNAGNLTINTPKLVVRDGGRVDSSTAATGSAGSVTINAPESVEVSGTVPRTLNPSLVSSGANLENEFARQIFGLPPVPSGASGDVTINTGKFTVKDGAQVTVRNQGSGNAGNVRVSARSIFLDNSGGITAATQSGEGGNISLKANSLQMRSRSQISARAGGTGNGGNITSNTDILAALENSDITADAVRGMGGNVQINTQGLFLCGDCQITASSDLGVDGVVEIVTPDTETSLEFIDLPEELTNTEQVVARACPSDARQAKSELTITGRGGLPPGPSEPLSSQALVSFDPPFKRAENSSGSAITKEADTSELPPPAQGWYVNAEGVVVLTAQATTANPYNFGSNPPDCHDN